MKYRALYRQTRPEVFSEIIGQDSIVKILRHQIATDTVSHAYLFTGTRGTGKTTTARILAKGVNCLDPDPAGRPCGVCENCRAIAEGKFLDVIEIDAASNNGVDNIRELRESVNYPPSVGRKKVYIIDEVHMLTPGAYNALLKTLEEPPDDVMFILATTDPERLTATVRSRCMRLDFRRVPQELLASHMAEICESRGVKAAPDALRLLAANADGSVRDSLSILEQCLSTGLTEISRDDVLEVLGTESDAFFLRLTDDVFGGRVADAFLHLDGAVQEGKDVRQLMNDWMTHLRSVLITKYVPRPEGILNLSDEQIAALREQSARTPAADLEHAIVTLARAIRDARYSTQARTLMEVAVVAMASGTEYGTAGSRAGGSGGFGTAGVAGSSEQSKTPGGAAPSQAPGGEGQVRAPGAGAQAQGPASGPAEGGDPEDLEAFWEEVRGTLMAEDGRLSLLKRTRLARVDQISYQIAAESDFVKNMVQSHGEAIDREMSRRLGRDVQMDCRVSKAARGGREEKLKQEAEKASEVLGVDVRVVDGKRK